MAELKAMATKQSLDVFSRDMATYMDKVDPVAHLRQEFFYPKMKDLHGVDHSLVEDSEDSIYLCGNSLGLAPKGTTAYVHRELDKWAKQGVYGHHMGDTPWEAIDLFAVKGNATLTGSARNHNHLFINLHRIYYR